jgi:hypothetical protein
MAMPCHASFRSAPALHPTDVVAHNQKDVGLPSLLRGGRNARHRFVAVHITTRARQNMLMVALVPEPKAAAFARMRHEFPDRVIDQRRKFRAPNFDLDQ